MSATKLSLYQRRIRRVAQCSAHDARLIEDIMRTGVLHTVALDWLNNPQFDDVTREAAILLNQNRAEYEEFYTGARGTFEQMRRESELAKKSPTV